MPQKAKRTPNLPEIETWDDLPEAAPPEGAVLMNFDVWRDIQDHPRQRDTVRHATAKHFKEAKEARGVVSDRLADVDAAIFKGEWYKIDGHTRTFLWENGELPLPRKKLLRVRVFDVKSHSELNKLYKTYDAPSAAERPYEMIFGAMRELGMDLRSSRLKRGHFKDALHLAIRGIRAARQPRKTGELDLYEATAVYRDEILVLDATCAKGMKPEIFMTGPLAAALITLTIWPESEVIWRRVNEKKYVHQDDAFDASGVILEMIRQGDQTVTRAGGFQEGLFRACLMAVKLWQKERRKGKEKWFRRLPHPLDPFPLIEEVREIKGFDYSATLFRPPSEMADVELPPGIHAKD